MPAITINNQAVDVPEGLTVLQACELAGIEIPYFCYHPKLSIAGNCRMCLVRLDKSPKPIASCATPVQEGMVIHTDTPEVTDDRKAVLEFLLINHPLDCPICDQGGECDLQDLSHNYGRDGSRFELNKRAVTNKNLGPLIKTVMTRCIHCTRCVRFANEIAGVPEMGAFGRGEHVEIGPYLEKTVTSELSGNLIDVCPVGALTNLPYAFKGRSWELEKTDSIDVMDGVGSHVRVDSRGGKVLRVLPRPCEDINEEWISDKARFSTDGLSNQRLDKPYIKEKGRLIPTSWENVMQYIAENLLKLKGQEIAAIAGDQADCESMFALKELMTSLKSPYTECRQDGCRVDSGNRGLYLFNTTIAGIEESDFVLIIGSNPRLEAPLVNARIRKNYLATGLSVAVLGPKVDLTYPYEHIGESPRVLKDMLKSTHSLSKALKSAKRPMIILGQGALNRRDSLEIVSIVQDLCDKFGVVTKDWNGFNVLHHAANRVGGMELGFVTQTPGVDLQHLFDMCQDGNIKAVYLLNADEFDMRYLHNTFVIYQGHHGDAGAHRADVILPGLAYTEKSATYVNTEGRPQRTHVAVPPPGDAKEDWKIIRYLSEFLNKTLPYNTIEHLRGRLEQHYPVFQHLGQITPAPWKAIDIHTPETLSQSTFHLPIQNYYQTDPISRHSITMAQCVSYQGGKSA